MSNEETPQWQPVKGRGRKRNLILISAAALLIFAVSVFVAYFKYDVWKSPKNIYLETEFVNFLSLSDEVKDSLELVSESLSKNIRTQDELSFQINTKESLGEIGDQLIDFLNKTTLLTDSVLNDKEKKISSTLTLKTDDEKWLDLALASENDVLALSIPTIDPELYLKLDLKNKKLQEKLGAQSALPQRIVNSEEWMKVLNFDNDELRPILSGILDAYVNNITNEQVQIEKDVTYKIGGKSIETRKLTLTFTPKQLDQMLDEMYKNVVLNKDFQNLMYAKYSEILKLLEESGLPIEDKVSKTEMIKAMEDIYHELKVDGASEQMEDVHMTLYIDGDKNIISRQVHFADQETDVVVGIDQLKIDGFHISKVDIVANEKKNDGGLRFSFENSETSEDQKLVQDLKINLSIKDEVQPVDFNWKSTMDTINKDQIKKQELKFSVDFNSPDTDKISLSGSWSEDSERSEDSTNYRYQLSLDFDKPDSALAALFPVTDIQITLKGKRTYPDRIELPKLTANNSLDIGSATDEQLAEAGEAYALKALEFYANNQQRLSFLDSFLQ